MPILMRMGMFVFRLVMSISVLLVVGCKKPLANPESIDPIYSDLLKMEKDHLALYNSKLQELDAIKKDWDTADALSGRKKTAKSRFFAKEKELEREKQLARYYRLRAKTRKQEARKTYAIYFEQDKPWPPAEEYESFLAENRLRNANKTWDSRVPRWNQRLKSAAAATTAAAEKKKKPAAEGAPPSH